MQCEGGGESTERKSESRAGGGTSPGLVTLAQMFLGKMLPKRTASVRFGKQNGQRGLFASVFSDCLAALYVGGLLLLF